MFRYEWWGKRGTFEKIFYKGIKKNWSDSSSYTEIFKAISLTHKIGNSRAKMRSLCRESLENIHFLIDFSKFESIWFLIRFSANSIRKSLTKLNILIKGKHWRMILKIFVLKKCFFDRWMILFYFVNPYLYILFPDRILVELAWNFFLDLYWIVEIELKACFEIFIWKNEHMIFGMRIYPIWKQVKCMDIVLMVHMIHRMVIDSI